MSDTLDIDRDTDLASGTPPRAIDPRDHHAIQLLSRGHASFDEVMQASFGQWPPRGLDIARPNTDRIELVRLVSDARDPANPAFPADYGEADTEWRRRVSINTPFIDHETGLIGPYNVSSVTGHEAVHIVQGDHHHRARDSFGADVAHRIQEARSHPVADLLAHSLMGRYRDYDQPANRNIDYFSQGLEIQARIHEIMAAGHSRWSQFPQNREQFLVAMHGAGVDISEWTLEQLKRSPSYEQTVRDFPAIPARDVRAQEINYVSAVLTPAGRTAFEQDTLPRMYTDLLEMYGDRLGRERFGYGPNEYELLRQPSSNPNALPPRQFMMAEVPDFQFKPGANGSVEIDMSQFRNKQYDAMHAALKEQGISYRTADPGGRDERVIVDQADLAQLNELKRRALTVTDRYSPNRTDQMFLNEIDFGRNGRRNDVINLDYMDRRSATALVEFLDQNKIEYRESTSGGENRLILSPQEMDRLKGLRAEVQLARSISADPTSPEYHLQAARMAASRQLLDADVRPLPPSYEDVEPTRPSVRSTSSAALGSESASAGRTQTYIPVVDLDLSTQGPRPVIEMDPRDRMSIQLMSRGHATVDEIMHASYGEWPPRGLDLIGRNDARVSFVTLEGMVRTSDPDVLRDAGSALGRAQVEGGQRDMWINPGFAADRAGRFDNYQVSSVLAHEGVHIVQGDHYQRAPLTFSNAAGNVLLHSQTANTSNLLATSVFERHTDGERYAAAVQAHKIDYLREGIEIQARVNQIMADGYQQWRQMPQNREQFLIAMQGAGVELSQDTQAQLRASPTYEQNRRIFTPVPHAVANDINLARSTLTDAGQAVFERETLTRMYSDLIEMYGDRQGRERFGFGQNEYARLREAELAGERLVPRNGRDLLRGVPDFSFSPLGGRGNRGVEIPLRGMTEADTARLREALETRGIAHQTSNAGTRHASIQVGFDDLERLRELKRDALALNPDSMRHPGRFYLDKLNTASDRDGGTHIFVTDMNGAQRLAFEQELKREGIKFETRQQGGQQILKLDLDNTRRFNSFKAEVEMGRPRFLDPTTAEYHLAVARAEIQRQLADPTYRPPEKPTLTVYRPGSTTQVTGNSPAQVVRELYLSDTGGGKTSYADWWQRQTDQLRQAGSSEPLPRPGDKDAHTRLITEMVNSGSLNHGMNADTPRVRTPTPEERVMGRLDDPSRPDPRRMDPNFHLEQASERARAQLRELPTGDGLAVTFHRPGSNSQFGGTSFTQAARDMYMQDTQGGKTSTYNDWWKTQVETMRAGGAKEPFPRPGDKDGPARLLIGLMNAGAIDGGPNFDMRPRIDVHAAAGPAPAQPPAAPPPAPAPPPPAPVTEVPPPKPPAGTAVPAEVVQPVKVDIDLSKPPPPPAPARPVPPTVSVPAPVARVDIDLSRPATPPPPAPVKPAAAPAKVDIDLSEPARATSTTASLAATGGKVDRANGHAGTAVRTADQLAQGNVAGAATVVATEVGTNMAITRGVRFVGQRIPVIGSLVTAGFVAWTVGTHVVQGNYGRAASELAAGSAEAVANFVGFGAGDVAREAVRGAVVATAGDKYAPDKSGVRQAAETAIDMGRRVKLDSQYRGMSQKDLGAAIVKDAGIPDTVKLGGKDVSILVALEDKKFREEYLKKLQAEQAGGKDTMAQIAMVQAYENKLKASAAAPPEAQYRRMNHAVLGAAIIKDATLPDTVKLGGKDVSLLVALDDKAFREKFLKGLVEAQAAGHDLTAQIAMIRVYDEQIRAGASPVTPTRTYAAAPATPATPAVAAPPGKPA